MNDDGVLDFAEVARRIKRSPHFVKDLVNRGAIRAFRPAEGKPLKIFESELRRYLSQKKNYDENNAENEITETE